MNPKKVLFINNKGGVGKSTMVDEMCFQCDIRGIPYSMHNLDPQGTLLHDTVNNPDAVLDFIDTPGHLQDKAKKYIEAADCIVIPTAMTQNCLSSIEMMLAMCLDVIDKKPVILLYNFWDGGLACEHFQDYMDGVISKSDFAGKIQIVHVSRSVNFANAREHGQAVEQYRRNCKSAGEIEDLFCHIMDRLDMYDWYTEFMKNQPRITQEVELTVVPVEF